MGAFAWFFLSWTINHTAHRHYSVKQWRRTLFHFFSSSSTIEQYYKLGLSCGLEQKLSWLGWLFCVMYVASNECSLYSYENGAFFTLSLYWMINVDIHLLYWLVVRPAWYLMKENILENFLTIRRKTVLFGSQKFSLSSCWLSWSTLSVHKLQYSWCNACSC